MNVPIKDIKENLNHSNLDKTQSLLSNRVENIDEEINKLVYYKQNVQLLLNELSDFADNSSVELRTRPKLFSIIIDSIIDDFESSLLVSTDNILKELQPFNLWFSFSQNISIISKSNLIKGNYHSYLSNGIISHKPLNLKTKNFKSKTYEKELCLFKAVVVTDESYRSIDKHYESMKSWAFSNGFLIDGDGMEVNIYNQKEQSYIQIWIPVKKTDNSSI